MTEPRHTADTITDDALDALYARAERAEAELDRLREGEEPYEDPRVELSNGQWLHGFNRFDPDRRLQIIDDMRREAQRGNACFLMNHDTRLTDDRKAWVIVARIRDVVDEMERITGARHWARILRSALDGPGPGAVEGTEAALDEQPGPATSEPHTGLIIDRYRTDRGEIAWCFRCWGTDTCDGWLSLDHFSQQSAERARDRHVSEEHAETGPAATQATEPDDTDMTVADIDHAMATGTPVTVVPPREHCGELSPAVPWSTVRTGCVLHPRHHGSHADDVGCRWTTASPGFYDGPSVAECAAADRNYDVEQGGE